MLLTRRLAKRRRIRPASSPDGKVIWLLGYRKHRTRARCRKDGNIIQFHPARNQSCYYTAVFSGLLHSAAYPPISLRSWAPQQYESLLNNNAFTLHAVKYFTYFPTWNTPKCSLKREAVWWFIGKRSADVHGAAPVHPSWAAGLPNGITHH